MIWGNVPQRNKNFTGRADIFAQLRRGESSKVTAVLPGDPVPHALQGLGGIGKTAVAIEYAYRFRSEYDLVWWIPADEPALVRSSLAALAVRLVPETSVSTRIDSAAAVVLDALRRGDPYRRWLLIFDNADQPEDLIDLIPIGPGDILITSRNHRWQGTGIVDTVQIDVFDRAESTEFLTKRVPQGRISQAEAALIAEKLGDLPLALEQAGALHAETGMSVDEYVRLLDEHTVEMLEQGTPTGYPRSMTAAWMLSVATLQQKMPEARELLRCCAFFGPDPIPRDVFRSSAQAADSRIGDLLANPIRLAGAIRELGRFALVKIEDRGISVHRLVQALLRDELKANEQRIYRREAHSILAASMPRRPHDSSLWPRYEQLVAHVGSPAMDMEHCREPAHRAFALDVVRYLYLSGGLASCRSLAERFIAAWTQDSGPDDPAVLDARRHLGNVLRELGQYSQAYDTIQATLKRTEEVLGPEDPLTLALRNSFGADLRASGEFVKAREFDEETLAVHRKVFGPDDPQTLRVMNNLAIDYGLNSDYVTARKLHQDVYLRQSEAVTGVSSPEILSSWNGLARTVRLCGNFVEARDLGEDVRDYGREKLGPQHYWTLRANNDLSIALRRIADGQQEALELAREVFDAYTLLLGERHPDTMRTAISLANVLRMVGDTDQALAVTGRILALYPDVYGRDHPYTYACAGNLALLRRVMGDPGGARQLNEAALEGLYERLGPDHHYSLTIATNLASDLSALGESSGARALGEDTLARLRERLGENHPLTLGCAANLVADLRTEGAVDAADRLAADTMSRYADTLGADHPDAQAARAGQRLDFDFDPPPI